MMQTLLRGSRCRLPMPMVPSGAMFLSSDTQSSYGKVEEHIVLDTIDSVDIQAYSRNTFYLTGIVCANPILKTNKKGANQCHLTIAIKKRGRPGESDFYTGFAYHGLASAIYSQVRQGQLVTLEGFLLVPEERGQDAAAQEEGRRPNMIKPLMLNLRNVTLVERPKRDPAARTEQVSTEASPNSTW
eukprot:CAMPEP_0119102964 /NCGR_PEP_ID=MMETSP1180-20130426/1539_1 /TAXON_ID=3052 ORGANISM="Chlamydomonas cf sp, Strain CCMP681" /NCGR_SAMPLE_ID=MMETSP1180 /ASSEMBLY_ACC=CAM_ASM_000741 /LENGTH=185 /DNA_ID=CAMNT_0007087359 /DNA_START=24 /DNA_END=581 /DNA_ORIENTATION=+